MKLAIASGKGGTGKTTICASLAAIWPRPLIAVDLDVEEPNLHLFLKPDITGFSEAFMEIPEVDESKCDYCGKCAGLCQFKAISVFNDVIMTFPEMCHGCGGCMDICPHGAVFTGKRLLGEIHRGWSGRIEFVMGRLRVGEAMSPPLMRRIKNELNGRNERDEKDILIDAPPGVSCPAVNAVMGCDAVVLVTEPTPFGLYDLKLAVKAFKPLNLPIGVVVNRAGIGDDAVYKYCKTAGIGILAEIPYERSIAEIYAQGDIISRSSDRFRKIFTDLRREILRLYPEDMDQKGSSHV